MTRLHLVPLHTRLDLVQSCIQLLSADGRQHCKNDRLNEIERNCPDPPCSLVLVSEEDIVIGHCRITPVKDIEDMVYIERVLIEKSRRGRGLGKRLFEMLEDYCFKLGFRKLYLGAKPETSGFYLSLGYKFTDLRPAVIGSSMLGNEYQYPAESLPYPGWEKFYVPFDVSQLTTNMTKVQYHSSLIMHTSSKVIVERKCERANKHDKNVVTKRGDVVIPKWAFDSTGYCRFKKDINV